MVGRVRLGPSEYLLRAVLRRDQECGPAADTRIRRAPLLHFFVPCSPSDLRRPPGPVPRECGPFVTLSAPRFCGPPTSDGRGSRRCLASETAYYGKINSCPVRRWSLDRSHAPK